MVPRAQDNIPPAVLGVLGKLSYPMMLQDNSKKGGSDHGKNESDVL